jgi:hypothetical protein
MKFTVTMRDPGALDDAIKDAVKEGLEGLDRTLPFALPALRDRRRRARRSAREIAEKWFHHGEYLSVEIDTDAKTCTVLLAI